MGLFQFLQPPRCPACNRENAEHLCQQCRLALEEAMIRPEGRCNVCYFPLFEEKCTFCQGRNVFFDRHRSFFRLNKIGQDFLRRWKFENDRFLYLTMLPVLFKIEDFLLLDINRIVYISSGKSGLDTRNYQPCADLSVALSDKKMIEQGGDLKKKGMRKQSSRDYAHRFFSVHDSIGVYPERTEKKTMHEGHYLLIEDVFTTGATANEAARILKKAGVKEVTVISLFLREKELEAA